MMPCPLRVQRPRGQSLIEFALLLPAVLIMIMMIVRMMLILNLWYTVTAAAEIAVRAAALTNNADSAKQIVLDNLPGVDPNRIHIEFEPSAPVFYTTPTPIPTATGTRRANPTATPIPKVTIDPLASIDPFQIPDYPIRITITIDELLAGPMIPDLRIKLSASAIGRLEVRLNPLPTMGYF